ncbi:MAG TPA: tyrosine-type recombinase/integrase [Ktedonobacteraceae bacterium]|nr:tyrosine-type recombinase/integrase [Ktedonobacteraceae bacterium]
MGRPQRVTHTFADRRALLRSLAPRYQQASPVQKTLLLDSFVEWTGYTRKYAIELLNHGAFDQQTIQRHRLPQYCPAVQQALFLAWKATHYVCAKRLLPSLPGLVAVLERQGHVQLTEEEHRQVLAMSLSTAERYLRTQRKPRLHGLSTTTPGPRGKAQIPVRIFSPWEEKCPGFVEMDLVAHCGDHLDGRFLHTLTLTDLATGWTECIPLLEKSAAAVLAALEQARTLFPFPLLGVDADSGGEFLNAEVIAYCEQEQLTFTRGRPGIKNDQAHVEQKNGAVVREAVGCVRLVGVQAYQQLREVYQALRLVVNYFQPSLQLQGKVSTGNRVRRVYDIAQTPLQRLLASGTLSETQQRDWSEWVQQIDPLALSEHLDALRYALWCGAHLPPQRAADERAWPPLGFSLAACTFVLRTSSEEGSEGTEHQETPSSREENLALVQTHPEWTSTQIPQEVGRQVPSRTVFAPMKTLMHDLGAVSPPLRTDWGDPWPPERIQGDSAASSPTELHLLKGVGSEACQPSIRVHPLPALAPGMTSSSIGEHEASPGARITVEQAIAAYVQEMRVLGHEPKTLQWHQTSLRALQRYLWKQFHCADVGQLSRVCLQTWVNDLPLVLSSRTGAMPTVGTVAAYARSARAFCNWLARQGYVSEPLFPKEAVPHAPQGLPQPVEPEAFVRLLRACQLPGPPGGLNAGMTARNRAILWLLLDTGLQVSELRGLRLADVDRADGTVTVRGKRGHQRMLPLSADGKRALCAYLDEYRLTPAWEPAVPEAQDRLLLTEQRHPLSKNSLTLLFVRLSQRAGFTRTPICPSMLRDTYAIHFLQAGGELQDLQEQLGLADPVSIRRYQRFSDEQRRAEQRTQASPEEAMSPWPSPQSTNKRGKARG